MAELGVTRWLRGLSPSNYLASFNSLPGAISLQLFLLFAPDRATGPRIAHGGLDLAAMAHDAIVSQQASEIRRREAGHLLRVEAGEGLAVVPRPSAERSARSSRPARLRD
jgi:hypothetical protein